VSICLSSSDVNLFISHGDIPPAIQTPASSVTMESAFSLERFSAIAADLDYVLLLGQPLPEFLCTAWHISSQPAPSVPLVLGQRVLLVSPASCHDRVTPHDSARPLVCYRLKSDRDRTPPTLRIHLRSDS